MGATPVTIVKSPNNPKLKEEQHTVLCLLQPGDVFTMPHDTGDKIWLLTTISSK